MRGKETIHEWILKEFWGHSWIESVGNESVFAIIYIGVVYGLWVLEGGGGLFTVLNQKNKGFMDLPNREHFFGFIPQPWTHFDALNLDCALPIVVNSIL